MPQATTSVPQVVSRACRLVAELGVGCWRSSASAASRVAAYAAFGVAASGVDLKSSVSTPVTSSCTTPFV
eukprot:2274512-Rhodomonas_salina.1